jgi:hypothetical protein
MGRACSTNGGDEECTQILVRKPQEKKPLGRPRSRWVDNIKTDLRETGWDDMGWMDMARDGSCEHSDETSGP